jgi:hypothetical protein
MRRSARTLLALALLCVVGPVFPRGDEPLTKQDVERRANYPEVYRLNMRGLVEATLTKAKDLSRKGLSTYFCEYSTTALPRPCDHMDTVSGQYEDYFQSQMACAQRCPKADVTQSSWNYITGTKRICRELGSGSCEKAALTVDQMREELIDLLRLEDDLRHARIPAPAGAEPEPPQVEQ